MLISSIALLAFMFFVSFTVWPQAVLLVSFLAGVLVTLQYLLFGAHRIVLGIRWMFKKIGAGFSRLFSRNAGSAPDAEKKDDEPPKYTPTVDNDQVIGGGEGESEKKV